MVYALSPFARRVGRRLLRPTGLLEPVTGQVTKLDLRKRDLAERTAGVATRLHDHLEFVGVEHLPPRVRSARWGHGRPSNSALLDRISLHRASYEEFVAHVRALAPDLRRIAVDESDETEPCWRNAWFPAVDTAALYTMLRTTAPSRYLEVGSGYSTRVAARAVRDGGLSTSITSIDPFPRASIDALCDEVVRAPVEECDPSVWDQLVAGDVVFFDGSHRALMHSDATVFFLEVLPRLPHGVRVGIHDILLPDDYFSEWGSYLWSEQYLLGAFLLADAAWLRPVFAAYWSSCLSDVTAPLDPLWDELDKVAPVDRRGWSYWFDIDRSTR